MMLTRPVINMLINIYTNIFIITYVLCLDLEPISIWIKLNYTASQSVKSI